MTAQRKIFCHEYVKDFNATQAAIRAGYSKRSAKSCGQRLLTFDDVNKYIKKHIQSLLSQTDIFTLQWVEKVKKIIEFDMRDVAEWSVDEVKLKASNEISDDAAYAIQEISSTKSRYASAVKIKAVDKAKALDLMGKYLAILSDNEPPAIDVSEKIDREERKQRILMLTKKI
jgi:phage terminase small subunit